MHMSQRISVTRKQINKRATILSSWKKATDKSIFFNGRNCLWRQRRRSSLASLASRLRDTRICTKLTGFLAWLTFVMKSFRFKKHYSIGTISGNRNIQHPFVTALKSSLEQSMFVRWRKGFKREDQSHVRIYLLPRLEGEALSCQIFF